MDGFFTIAEMLQLHNSLLFNPLRVAGERSRQCRTSSFRGGRDKSTEKHQPVSEGISWEPCIRSSHTAPQKIAKNLSFQVTKNNLMAAEQV